MSFMGLTAIAFPLFGAIFAVVWSILYDYEASVRTACRVSVFFSFHKLLVEVSFLELN